MTSPLVIATQRCGVRAAAADWPAASNLTRAAAKRQIQNENARQTRENVQKPIYLLIFQLNGDELMIYLLK